MTTQPKRTDEQFQVWRAAVSELVRQKFGLGLDDLPDMLTRSAFDEGVTPREFFDDEVMRLMREDFGSVIDELCGVP
jgi:hypothetical protein